MNLFRYLFSRAFIRNVLRIGVVWVVVIASAWVFLRVYSRHGEGLEVPALKGLTFDQAVTELAAVGLSIVHLDSTYSDEGIPFQVIEQVPPAGSAIKPERGVYVTTYRSLPPRELLSVEEGMDLAVARIILENKGMVLSERAEPNIALVNKVLRVGRNGVMLSANERVPRGSELTLVYGETTNERVPMPRLRGLSLDSARRTLIVAKLGVGLVEYSLGCEDAQDSVHAVVLTQHIAPNRSRILPAGTEIDLYLGMPEDKPLRPEDPNSL